MSSLLFFCLCCHAISVVCAYCYLCCNVLRFCLDVVIACCVYVLLLLFVSCGVSFEQLSVFPLFMLTGSASRLSRKSSYHHCTLLHSVDRSSLSAVLRPSCPGIHSNATPSVPSPVTNLIDHAPTLQWEELLDAVAQQFNTGNPPCNGTSVWWAPLVATWWSCS